MSLPTWTNPHPYLSGAYAPVADEAFYQNLPVVGELPRDLAGVFVRNSSNPRFAPLGRYHWFDGDGMLQCLALEDGKASYRNRWIRTKAFDAETEAGHALWRGVTERPDFTNPRGPFKDSANTDIVYHGGKLLALWWLGGEPYVIRLPELQTCGVETFGGKTRTVSAHPKVDAHTGEMMVFDYKPRPPYLSYGVVAADGTLAHFTTIDLPGPRLQHDMAITQNHTLLFDMSLMWDPELLAKGQTRVRFFPDKPTRIGVLPRYGKGESIRWFDCRAFYMYHTINAWEQDDKIILIGCRIDHPLAEDPNNPATDQPVPTIGFLRLAPHLWKWTLDLRTGRVSDEQLHDVYLEFPRTDNRRLGRPTRYSYNPRLARSPTINFDGVIKHDLHTGSVQTYACPEGMYCGETTFAPRADAPLDGAEDDGYVLSFVCDARGEQAQLYVLDAQRVEAGPLAKVAIPGRVPIGYHTWWVAAGDLARQQSVGTPS